MFKKGDRVLFWSLQSFSGPGFYKGHPATVKQDQYSDSVVLVPDQTEDRSQVVQGSYEVYTQQCQLLTKELDENLKQREELKDIIKRSEKQLKILEERIKKGT